jgi:hypothetical protein
MFARSLIISALILTSCSAASSPPDTAALAHLSNETVPIPVDTFAPQASTSAAPRLATSTTITTIAVSTTESKPITSAAPSNGANDLTLTDPATTVVGAQISTDEALMVRIRDLYRTYVEETLLMPNTSFPKTRSFYASSDEADDQLRRVNEAAKRGGSNRRGTPNIEEIRIESIVMVSAREARSTVCFTNNVIVVGGGPDGKAATPDDVIEENRLETEHNVETWRLIDGTWFEVSLDETTVLPGRVGCEA